MLTNKNKSDLHYVSVFAVGQLKDDDTHYFNALFRNKIDAEQYVKELGPLYSLFDLSFYMPKENYLRSGDTFTMPGEHGVKYASKN